MTTQDWEAIKQIYEEKFGVSGIQVDYIAVNEILKLTVSGISNEKISNFVGCDTEYISSTNHSFLGFKGWNRDLDINPWNIFCRIHGNKMAFEKEIWDLTNLLDSGTIDLAYRLCSIYNNIRKEINDFYEHS